MKHVQGVPWASISSFHSLPQPQVFRTEKSAHGNHVFLSFCSFIFGCFPQGSPLWESLPWPGALLPVEVHPHRTVCLELTISSHGLANPVEMLINDHQPLSQGSFIHVALIPGGEVGSGECARSRWQELAGIKVLSVDQSSWH